MFHLIAKINTLEAGKIDFFQFTRLTYVLSSVTQVEVKTRFSNSLNLSNPKGTIEKFKILKTDDGDIVIEAVARFFNIVGTTGVLPRHYTEYVISSKREKDDTLADFLDIFYDEIIKAFINIITKNDLVLERERSLAHKEYTRSAYLYRVCYLLGISPDICDPELVKFLLLYGGLLISSARSAQVLQSILTDYYQLKVSVEQFIEEKKELESNKLSRIGRQNSELGSSLYMGTRAYFNCNKILIHFLDLSYALYQSLVENQRFIQGLHQILLFYLPRYVNYDLSFHVLDQERKTLLVVKKPRKLGADLWCKG